MNIPHNVFLPAAFSATDATITGVYLQVEDAATNRKLVMAVNGVDGEAAPVCPEARDYGALTSCAQNGTIYLACTLMEDTDRSILLFVLEGGVCRGPFPVTKPGKTDNPAIAIHGGRLHICWELYAETTRIVHTSLSPADGLTAETCLSAGNSALPASDGRINAYRPRLASNGTELLLAFEGFANNRYHLLAQSLRGDTFSAAVPVGSTEKNDQEPSICACGGGFLLAYENSSPLYKDYRWVSPRGEQVIIPAFGHGWRVESKHYLKHLTINNNGIAAEALPASGDDGTFPRTDADGRVWLDDKESSGCPVVLSMGDSGFILLFIDRIQRAWNIRYTTFHNGQWSPLADPGITLSQRVPPAAQYDAATGDLMIFAPSADPSKASVYRTPVGIPGTGSVTAAMAPLADVQIGSIQPADARPVIQYHGKTLAAYWGDLHMHSNLSGCSLHPRFHCTEIEEKYRQCRDVGSLDFAMCTDHDTMNDHQWARTRAEAAFHNRPGLFTAFLGFEWTSGQHTPARQGHYNVLYRDTGKLYRLSEESGDDIRKVWDDLEEGKALTIPHHPADTSHPLDWNRFNPRFEPLVEIFQVRGSYEYPGNTMDPSNYRSTGMAPGLSIVEALERGYTFGFTAGGEHEGVGVTCVFAEENTRDAIFDALRKRHVYGTTGDRIFLDVRLNGQLMGESLIMPDAAPTITITVHGTAPIRLLRIMRDGKPVYQTSSLPETIALTWQDDRFAEIKGQRSVHHYYVVVEQENDEIAWASPIFLNEETP